MRRSWMSGSVVSCCVRKAVSVVRSTKRNPGTSFNMAIAAARSKLTRCFSAIMTSSAKTRGETMISCCDRIAPSSISRAKELRRSEPDQYHAKAWVSAAYSAIIYLRPCIRPSCFSMRSLPSWFDSFKLFSEFDLSQFREGAEHCQRGVSSGISLLRVGRRTGCLVQRDQFRPQIDGAREHSARSLVHLADIEQAFLSTLCSFSPLQTLD